MNPAQRQLLLQTRRHFFSQCGAGLGSLALASLMSDNRLPGADAPQVVNPLAPKPAHFPAKVKSVIYLFMAGGPSQLELFDPKPRLNDLNGKPVPESFIKNKRFAFLKGTPNLLGCRRKFAEH